VSLAALCHLYGIKELALFSSAARGETRPEGDLDLMVEFEPGQRVGMVKFEMLAEELAALVGRKIDLVTKRGLKPWIRTQVRKDAQLLYAETSTSTVRSMIELGGASPTCSLYI
jgi:predicted nucleotidyltransferase